jgi:hypothetical protein
MAITTADQFFTAATQNVTFRKTSVGTPGANAQDMSLWGTGAVPAAGTWAVGNTTTGVLFDNTYTGAPAINTFGAGATGYIARAKYRNSQESNLVLYDRLWGAGAISLITTATTTFSGQPSYTGRLPGGNDYGNIEIMLEMTTAASVGTGPTVVIGYTNEAGVSGRTTPSVAATVSLVNYVGRIIRFSLQAGDKGVQSVDSISVTAGTLTAGAANVIVARKLATFELRQAYALDVQAYDALGMPQVFATSCLWPVAQGGITSTGNFSLELQVING